VFVWFIAGTGFLIAIRLSLFALTRIMPSRWPVWWLGGFAFVGIELMAHLALQLRGRPNFYNGLG
jgi:hypothetical protein